MLGEDSLFKKPGVSLQQKLKYLKDCLKTWNRENFASVTQQKEELLQQIKELDEEESVDPLSEQFRNEGAKAKMEF